MHTVLTTTTEAAAATLQYDKRPDRVKFTLSTLVQTLVFGWLADPQADVPPVLHPSITRAFRFALPTE